MMAAPWIISHITQWIAILLIMVLVYRLMKLIGEYILKIEELERNGLVPNSPFVGKVFPKIQQKSINTSEIVTLNDQMSDPVTLLVFDTKCGACKAVLQTMMNKQINNTELPHRLIAAINQDTKDVIDSYSEKLSAMNIPLLISDDIVAMCKSKKLPIPYGFVIEKGIVTQEGSKVIDELLA